ncbi:YciI family protein [Rugamonas sp. A1-17]|nr:YciI family protein [Rugamonas sp. A1-17]
MEYMVLRRANQSTERGQQPPALEPGTFLKPSTEAVRLLRRDGVWSQQHGPFAPKELVAGFTLIEAASKEDAIEQVRWWPLFDSGAVYEIRDAGCPGNCVGFDERGTAAGTIPRRDEALTRYVIFIRSDDAAEANAVPPPEVIDMMNAYNEAGVQQGVLLAGEGLKASASATRVHFANSKTSVVDGPFTEVKELIAGYWMLQAASLDDAIAWAKTYPYPSPGDLTLEIREACERIAHQEFTPEMRAAEERLRAELLEAGLRDAFRKKARGG